MERPGRERKPTARSRGGLMLNERFHSDRGAESRHPEGDHTSNAYRMEHV